MWWNLLSRNKGLCLKGIPCPICGRFGTVDREECRDQGSRVRSYWVISEDPSMYFYSFQVPGGGEMNPERAAFQRRLKP